ncbi:MAG: hypothetical protein JNK18_04865 [Cyclobacteriaceae bacterium]|nr:hypothetical protein [Cyclobacteriaceae bacterium]
MNRIFIIISLFCLLISSRAIAQSSLLDTTHVFSSHVNVDLRSGQVLADTFHIEISASSLKLQSTQRTSEFPVENVIGTWTDISQAGELTFDILVLDVRGKGRLERVDGSLYLTIDLSERKDWMKRRFTLNTTMP